MKTLHKTTILVVVSGVFLLASLGVYAFFFKTMKDKTAKASEVALRANDLEGKQGDLSQNLTLLKQHASDIEKINSYFIKESQIVSFTERIESMGKEAGVDLVLEALDPAGGQGGTRVLNFRVKASGEYANVVKLLKFLESFPARFEFSGVRMFRKDGEVVGTGSAQLWSIEASIIALNFIAE